MLLYPCHGAALPWSSWSCHAKELQEKEAELLREIRQDAEPAQSIAHFGNYIDLEMQKTFANIRSKRQQRIEQTRGNLLSIRSELVQLERLFRLIPSGLIFDDKGERLEKGRICLLRCQKTRRSIIHCGSIPEGPSTSRYCKRSPP